MTVEKKVVDKSRIQGFAFGYYLDGEVDEIDVFATSYNAAKRTADKMAEGYTPGGELLYGGRAGITDVLIDSQLERYGMESFGL